MIYLDNAATTFPKPLCVSEEMSRCIKYYCGNPGRSSHSLSIKSAEKIYETRSLLADLFNGEPENVVFTYNTTYSLNIAIKSMLQYSSHVLISDIEHNSVLRPISSLAKQKLCTYDTFSTSGSEEDIINSIKASTQKNTKMLVCTHVSNVGCRTLPIKRIGKYCKENDITFIVDAAQSAGFYKIDIKDMCIDALCIPAHKGLYGPQGVGAVIFNINVLRSVFEGGTGINSFELDMPDFLPEMLEAGTLSTPAISGWGEALKWLKSLGIERISQHEKNLYSLSKNLLSLNNKIILYEMNDYDGNTLLFNVKGIEPTIVSNMLDEQGIAVRSGFHCSPLAHKVLGTKETGAIRISFSVFNSHNDVHQLINALERITK